MRVLCELLRVLLDIFPPAIRQIILYFHKDHIQVCHIILMQY